MFASKKSVDVKGTSLKPLRAITTALVSAIFFGSSCGEETSATWQSDTRNNNTPDQNEVHQSGVDTSSISIAVNEPEIQVELGQVRWGRDIELAKKQSATSGKPVLVLFQEVPG